MNYTPTFYTNIFVLTATVRCKTRVLHDAETNLIFLKLKSVLASAACPFARKEKLTVMLVLFWKSNREINELWDLSVNRKILSSSTLILPVLQEILLIETKFELIFMRYRLNTFSLKLSFIKAS